MVLPPVAFSGSLSLSLSLCLSACPAFPLFAPPCPAPPRRASPPRLRPTTSALSSTLTPRFPQAPPLPRAAPTPQPPRGGFLGKQRAAASSPVAGLNEACRTGAAATTALPPRPTLQAASYSSATLVRPSLPRRFFLPASPCHSTLVSSLLPRAAPSQRTLGLRVGPACRGSRRAQSPWATVESVEWRPRELEPSYV